MSKSDGRCDYREVTRCRESMVYEVQFDGRKHALCERHARPEFHPPDLHKKLPGAEQGKKRPWRPGQGGAA